MKPGMRAYLRIKEYGVISEKYTEALGCDHDCASIIEKETCVNELISALEDLVMIDRKQATEDFESVRHLFDAGRAALEKAQK